MSRLPIKPQDVSEHFKSGQPLIGLDLGEKTIGIAISDGDWLIASPHHTIQRKKFTKDATILIELIKERDVGGIVLGLPLNMDGSSGARVQATRDFALNLLRLPQFPVDLHITMWDERLTTQAAKQLLIKQADLSRKRQDALIDKVAAALILQNFLDSLPRLK